MSNEEDPPPPLVQIHRTVVLAPTGIAKVRMLVSNVVLNHHFDHVMGAVIIFNMLLIIVETDHAVHFDDPLPWVQIAGAMILIIFVVELGFRLFAFGLAFFTDGWNVFDFFVVVADLLCSVIGLILGSVFPASTLRIFRLCKLARVSKVFRVFPELRIMMAGLMGSFRAIFWGTVLLAFVLLVWSIVAVQFIHPINKTLEPNSECERCPRAYESVLQSTLTFCQQIVAGDSWGQATIPIIEAKPWTAFFFMGVYLTVAVAVMNLILGVVVNIASTEHDRLERELEEEKNIKKMCATNDILRICEEMDSDGNGMLSLQELDGFKHSLDFRTAIEELELKQEDLTMAFSTMHADHSGAVSYPEFVRKLYKMTDSDSAFMLEQLKYLITQVKDLLIKNMDQNQTQLVAFQEAEKATLEKIEQQEVYEKDLLERLVHQEKASVTNVDKQAMDNKPDVVNVSSDIREKEKRKRNGLEVVQTYSETAGDLDSLQLESVKGSLEFQIVTGRFQLTNEVLDSMQLESILELHAENTSASIASI